VSEPAAPPGWRCPTCAASVAQGGAWRPFCSERCKNVDLGAWLLGHYRIPAAPDPDADPDAGFVPPDEPGSKPDDE
jgi:endogenous inhibitor of DNA gyrase (YacG/DUF329 family)